MAIFGTLNVFESMGCINILSKGGTPRQDQIRGEIMSDNQLAIVRDPVEPVGCEQ
jgi:hypothetical protein